MWFVLSNTQMETGTNGDGRLIPLLTLSCVWLWTTQNAPGVTHIQSELISNHELDTRITFTCMQFAQREASPGAFRENEQDLLRFDLQSEHR